MEFVIVTIAYPALLVALAVGTGLLVDSACGWRVPGVLLAPLGLAGLVVVSQATTGLTATAPLTPQVLVAVAVLGLAMGRQRLRAAPTALRAQPWPLVGALAVYGLACAPVLLSGGLTFAGYLLDTTAAIQIAGADRLVGHGLDFSGLAQSGYRLQLVNYFGSQYPSGAHTVLGGTGRIVGGELLWLYQPFLSAMLAFCVPSLWLLARDLGMSRVLALATAFLASVPALVYAYTYQGAIKEITLLPLIVLLAALLVVHRRWLGLSLRTGVPITITAAAGIGVIGLAFGGWLALALAIVAVLLVRQILTRRLTPRRLGGQAAVAVALFALLTLGTLTDLGASATVAGSLSQGNQAAVEDPGNLIQPIHAAQAFGVWVNGSHRTDPPEFAGETYALIGFVLVGVVLGVGLLARRRALVLAAFAAGTAAIWWVLTLRGAVWTDAKLIVLVSPVVLLLAMAGAQTLISSGLRVQGALLASAIAVGVLWSDAVLYHETNMAPAGRFDELASIGERFAGDGPTLALDFDEYLLYLGRRLDVSAPGFAYKPANLSDAVGGQSTGYGHSYDLDQIPLRAIRRYRLLLVRLSPERSVPPSGYERVFSGGYYEVWRRTPASDDVIAHLGATGNTRATARPRCSSVRRLASKARRAGGFLRYVVRPENVVVRPKEAALTSKFAASEDGVVMTGAGRLDTTVRFKHGGDFRVWMKGDFSRTTQVIVDGKVVGEASNETGGEGNYAATQSARVASGRRKVAVRLAGGSWKPGNGATSQIRRLVFVPAGRPRALRVDPIRWRSVCERKVDWVEAVRG